MRKELLEILVCPENHMPVALADEGLLARINRAIGEGEVVNRGGEHVTLTLEAALVREDQQVAYPVRDGIPAMLLDEAIELKAIAATGDA